MGLTQTKLHHKILKQSWSSTIAHLHTPSGLRSCRQRNPMGDLPLHLACYSGVAPPSVIRELVLAFPEAVGVENGEGYTPCQLARINYGGGGTSGGQADGGGLGSRYRDEVLELLEGSFAAMALRVAVENGTGSAIVLLADDAADDADAADGGLPGGGDGGVSASGPGGGGRRGRGGGSAMAAPAAASAATARPEHTYVTSSTCVICLDAASDHVVVPCGHLCLCRKCAVSVRRGGTLCPVGRCVVGNIVKVDAVDAGAVAAADAATAAADAVAVAERQVPIQCP
mmetsp:Transcript_26832/g.58700  ORF Transcript_26832/g.58700 Transcript_26832/m.58700 type:complete len:285 (+) Transcript_26832:71-925(+)